MHLCSVLSFVLRSKGWEWTKKTCATINSGTIKSGKWLTDSLYTLTNVEIHVWFSDCWWWSQWLEWSCDKPRVWRLPPPWPTTSSVITTRVRRPLKQLPEACWMAGGWGSFASIIRNHLSSWSYLSWSKFFYPHNREQPILLKPPLLVEVLLSPEPRTTYPPEATSPGRSSSTPITRNQPSLLTIHHPIYQGHDSITW